jgi:hypothetical protein
MGRRHVHGAAVIGSGYSSKILLKSITVRRATVDMTCVTSIYTRIRDIHYRAGLKLVR